MASTYTTNYNLLKPELGRDSASAEGEWGTGVNANFDTVDTKLKEALDPQYDSGWISLDSAQEKILAHSLSGTPRRVFIQVRENSTADILSSYGVVAVYDGSNNQWYGVAIKVDATNITIQGQGAGIYRDENNTILNGEVRVMAWL